MTYGVLPTGFKRKPLTVILAELEAKNIERFGENVIQTAQSPLGQINGVMADAISENWELAEVIYQSYDPGQAEGTPQDRLARLRLLERLTDETDSEFAQAIINRGTSNVRDAEFAREIAAISDVYYSQIYVNESAVDDENGVPPQHIAVVVLGGENATIAGIARQYIVPGIGSYGNVQAETIVDGFCRTIKLLRPAELPHSLELNVTKHAGNNDCPPPSDTAVAASVWSNLTGDDRVRNGGLLDRHRLTVAMSEFPNIRLDSWSIGDNLGMNYQERQFDFDEIPTFASNDIVVNS